MLWQAQVPACLLALEIDCDSALPGRHDYVVQHDGTTWHFPPQPSDETRPLWENTHAHKWLCVRPIDGQARPIGSQARHWF
jgi:hypothetical protein